MPSDAMQAPPLRTFQFDQEAVGRLSKSVNLFRGDVNVTQDLFSLGAPPGKPELDVTVSLLYQSNVHRQAELSNRDAPTGVVGLGWSLPLDRIVVTAQPTPSPESWTYAHESGGVRNDLVREPDGTLLATVPSRATGGLAEGAAAGESLAAELGRRGVAVDPSATAAPLPGGGWTLTDRRNEVVLELRPAGGGVLEVRDGGRSYQLQDYRFWRISYYPEFERWVVVRESGATLSYGGGVRTARGGGRTSAGDSIAWGVRWRHGDDPGTPLWMGSSALVDDGDVSQEQYARAWYLVTVEDVWGDRIAYAYNGRERDEPLPGIEQRVGDEDGLPYTKACYLTSITDVYGRTISLDYAPKEWSDPATDPGEPREFLDPHKAVPDTTPNAYQDRYETLYLEAIRVADAGGRPMLRFDLAYDWVNVAGYDRDEPLYGDTTKRVLAAVTQRAPDGAALPGLVLDYCGGEDEEGEHPGALRSLRHPQGATATYEYARMDLEVCQRRHEVVPPPEVSEGGRGTPVPRMWFGPDYAVSTWYDSVTGRLSLRVFTWLGRWQAWQADPDSAVIFEADGGLDPASLTVAAQQDYLALQLTHDGGDVTDVYVFHRDAARPGRWLPYREAGGTLVTAPQQPSLRIDTSRGDATCFAGERFLAVHVRDTVDGTSTLERHTYRWTEDAWTREVVFRDRPGDVAVAVGSEYVLTADIREESLEAALSWLDQVGAWHDGDTATVPVSAPLRRPVQVSGVGTVPGTVLVAGPSFAALGALQSANWSSQVRFQLTVLQWDAAYRFLDLPFQETLADRVSPGETYAGLPYVPQVTGTANLACGGNVLRFDGSRWLRNSRLVPQDQRRDREQRYAHGPDYTVQTVYSPSATTAALLAFDPDTDVGDWDRDPVEPQPPAVNPSHDARQANWPTAGGADYLTVGQHLYHRGTSNDWVAPAEAPIATFGDVVDTQAVVDQGPAFLSYPTGSGTGTQSHAVLLRNGLVQRQETLGDGERYHTSTDPSHGSGTSPSGPGSFVTYPASASSLDSAPRLYLYRWAADGIAEPLVHYPVTSVRIDDGYGGERPTAYAYDAATAACDPTGSVVKFFEATTYPGCARPEDSRAGWTVSRYVNGLERQDVDDHAMLDGFLDSVETFDASGQRVAVQRNRWEVVTARSADPATEVTVPLHGGAVVQVGQDDTRDGVTTEQETHYVPEGLEHPYSGLPVGQATRNTSGDGAEERWTLTRTYAYEVDERARALGLLVPVVQTVTRRAPAGGGDAVVTGASATTLKGWEAARGDASVDVPGAEAGFAFLGGDFEGFPFATYRPGDVPDGWCRESWVRGRGRRGMVTESVDAAGVPRATRYDAAERFVVADVTGAALDECAYIGFEAYEDTAGWELSGGAEPAAGDAHTGDRALPLAGGGSLATSVAAAAGASRYVLVFWYRTPAGFDEDGAGWAVEVVRGGETVARQRVPFDDTGGAWQVASAGIAVPDGDGDAEVRLTATNPAAGAVLLDDCSVRPLDAEAESRAYDPAWMVPTAAVGNDGGTSRVLRDGFHREAVTVEPGTAVAGVTSAFLSRQGNAGCRFDPGDPNAKVEVAAAGGGTAETFRDGDGWRDRWDATGDGWSVAGGLLEHAEAGGGTLSPVGAAVPAALYAQVVPAGHESFTKPVGVDFGDGLAVRWDPGEGRWQLVEGDGPPVDALAAPPAPGRAWLALATGDLVLFYADGQLLFSHRPSDPPGPPSLAAGGNALTVRNLALLLDPRVEVTFADATGSAVQHQSLLGDDALVQQTVYDEQARAVARTLPAPAGFGSGADQPLLRYRPGFVDLEAFRESLGASGRMTGDVADYYDGDPDDPARSDAGGYPYARQRFEDSPLGRVVEEGQPGERYAVRDLGTTTPAERQTVQYAYGTNDGTVGPVDLPAGQYRRTTRVSPLKSAASKFVERGGDLAATGIGPDGDAPGLVTQSFSEYDAEGKTTTRRLPNHFAGGGESFAVTTRHDLQERLVRRDDADTGTTRMLYDQVGRLRFRQYGGDPDRATPVQYFRYDTLGRLVERGTFTYPWDDDTEAELAGHAGDQAWPPAGDTDLDVRAARRIAYDGTGDDPAALGRTAQVVTLNRRERDGDRALVTVTETYAYRPGGLVARQRLEIEGSGDADGAYSFDYDYDNLGNLVRVGYPEAGGRPIGELRYTYDEVGRTRRLRLTEPGSDEAVVDLSFGYDPGGNLLRQDLPGGLRRTARYEPTAWVAALEAACDGAAVEQSFDYGVDGALVHRRATFAYGGATGGAVAGGPPVEGAGGADEAFDYRYDELERLVAAKGEPADLDLEVTDIDPNGNLLGVETAAGSRTFRLAPGTDLVVAVEAGEHSAPVEHDRAGRVTRTPHPSLPGVTNSLRYDEGLGLVAAAAVRGGDAGCDLELSYGARGQRVLKRVTRSDGGGTTVLLAGASTAPLVEIRPDGVVHAFVQGPGGLAATRIVDAGGSATTALPVVDQEGSVRALLDPGGGLLEGYDYLPYGALARSYGPVDVGFTFAYTGQPLDRETGLYDLHARWYDPGLRRFLAPDPARQFASPYVYAGDDPSMEIDPSGDLSVWATVGITAAMVGVAALGIGLSLVTGGASAAASGAIEGALAGAVASGTIAAGTATTIASVGGFAAAAAVEITAGVLFGAGFAGAQYTVTNSQDFTWKGFGEQVAIGAVSGAAAGAASAALTPLANAATTAFITRLSQRAASEATVNLMRTVAPVAGKMAVGATAGAVRGATGTLTRNAIEGRPWDDDLAWSTALGAAKGAAFTGAQAVGGRVFNRLTGQGGRLNAQYTQVRAALLSDTAKIYGALIGGHLVVGYGVWGLYTYLESSNSGAGA